MATPMLQTRKAPMMRTRTPWAPGSNLNQLSKQKAHLMGSIEDRKAQGIASPRDQMKLRQVNQGLTGVVNNAKSDLNRQLGNLRTQAGQNNKPQPWQVPTDSADLNAQRAHIAAGIEARKAKGIKSPKDEARLAKIDAALAAQNTGTQPITETTPTDTGSTPPTDTGPTDDVENGAGNVFFPSQQAFEPQNYEGSPLYKFQQQEGTKALNRVLAKRGLLDSGAEIEANNRFQQALGAGEADKARGYAQQEADRYERMSQNEALRREREGGRASDNAFRWTDLMLRQNPMDYAFKGTGQYADTVGSEGKTMANYLQQLYTRATGGGGGGGPGPFILPFPTGPDFSNIDVLKSLTGGSNNNSFWNAFINSLPGFLDPKNWA